MPLDPRVRRFLDVLAAGGPVERVSMTMDERRASLAALMKFGGPGDAVERIDSLTVPGPTGPLATRVYSPGSVPAADGDLLPALIYFHGGGLVAGSLDSHDGIARALTQAGACRVVAVDYRLAPEHPFPAAVEDAIQAVREVRARAASLGIDRARLGLCGDSAGGTLAAVAAQALAREPSAGLVVQLLLCPITDYAGQSTSRRELATGYLVSEAILDHDLAHYLPPGVDARDPRVSPLRATQWSDLPPTLVHTAEFDPLRDEGAAYAAEIERAGGVVRHTCHPGMIHLFYGLGGVIPYARTAWTQIGAELRAAFAAGRGYTPKGS